MSNQQLCGLTSIVFNVPEAKIFGLPPFYYRERSCNTNLTGQTPADQYQRLKLIQNTVRVPASLYTANIGPLTAYKQPTAATHGVCWNQMSDRPVPSVQRATVPTGTNCALNRRHTSVTSSRPGCQTPGGVGCDIKHNSYDRYLNRLKGKGPLKRGVIPPYFGRPIVFNPAFPVYGGKTTKTNIVSGCDCGPNVLEQTRQIYGNPLWQPYPEGDCSFQVGQIVFAINTADPDNQCSSGKTGCLHRYSKAEILSVSGTGSSAIYTIEFLDSSVQASVTANEIRRYAPCNCYTASHDVIVDSPSDHYLQTPTGSYPLQCAFPASLWVSSTV